MQPKDVIDVLSHYRHDIMNQLQLIQGYLSMGKLESVQEKMTQYIEQLHSESKLVNLGLPGFALWLIRFNSTHTNYRLTYSIYGDQQSIRSSFIDDQLVFACSTVIHTFQEITDDDTLYHGHLSLSWDDINKQYQVHISLNDVFEKSAQLEKALQHVLPSVIVHKEEQQLSCTITIESNE
ncbi:Spo0B domain-containing protein [Lentibacillus saliphilus]|uniref:Spo0B domain-containing protein n=1 Tax=Lentibacillus saliphilus TaxID=2737028 RepID=UPI001C2F4975|nr:Spo0B domain-containing protein [Lentibacillus saliphilus]